MFGFFSKKKQECPIDPQMRLWMENSFLWLVTQFGQDDIFKKPILVPTPECFPLRFDGSEDSLMKTAEIVARQMDIDINEVNLEIYEQGIQEFNGGFGNRISMEVDKNSDEKMSVGLYFGRNEQNKYDVFIERQNLNDPENLVATLAHEFSHIKLLGEERIDFNDNHLTDLTSVVFGLGIFNANTAYREWRSFDGYSNNSIGYLKQREWGYALALYTFFKQNLNPEWTKYLTDNVKSDVKKSLEFIYANHNRIFCEEYKPDDQAGNDLVQ